jgi:hypothetical protein
MSFLRRFLGLLPAMVVLGAMIPATTTAAPPTRLSGSQTGILCELSSESGFISVFVQTAGTDAFAFMAVWAADTEPLEDLPTIVSADSGASLEASSLRATFELVTWADERSAGSASLGIELTASGAPMVWSKDGRDGNRRFTVEQVTQLLTVDGTLIIDLFDGSHDEVELSTCLASTDSATFFASNPNAWVYGSKQVFVSCEWATEVGSGRSDERTSSGSVTTGAPGCRRERLLVAASSGHGRGSTRLRSLAGQPPVGSSGGCPGFASPAEPMFRATFPARPVPARGRSSRGAGGLRLPRGVCMSLVFVEKSIGSTGIQSVAGCEFSAEVVPADDRRRASEGKLLRRWVSPESCSWTHAGRMSRSAAARVTAPTNSSVANGHGGSP